MLISILGRTGSGKSEVAEIFKKIDPAFYLVDSDKIIHEIYQKETVKKTLIKKFGATIQSADGLINRKELGRIVFNDGKKLLSLEKYLYKEFEKIFDEILLKNEKVLLEGINIYKSKYFNMSNLKICVLSDKENRAKRIIKRDNISMEEFEKRDNFGNDYIGFVFDYYIFNNWNMRRLKKEVKKIYKESIKCA